MSTNGIDFVIGGKDQAKPAMAAVEQSLQRLEKSTDSLKLSTASLAKATAVVAGAWAALNAAVSAMGGIKQGIDDFDAAEESMRSLAQAMALNGNQSEVLVQQYGDLSDAVEKTTNVAAEEFQALMKQAAVMGVSSDKLDDMALAAVGLSESLGISLDAALEKVRLASEGNFRAFEKMLPAIKEMKTDEEKLAAVMELSARGMELKKQASHSAGGEAERMNHRIGNLMETIGAILSPLRQLAYQGITVLADVLSSLLSPAADKARSAMENMGSVAETVKTAIVSAINRMISAVTAFQVVITNLDKVWEYALLQAELGLIALEQNFKDTFTVIIPAYAVWLKNNLPGLIKAAVTGAEKQLSELPQFEARQLTAREKQLQEHAKAIEQQLGAQFAEKLQGRLFKEGADAENIAQDIALDVRKQIEQAAAPFHTVTLDEKSKTASSTMQPQSVTAVESRLLTRGPASSIESKMYEELQQGNRLMKGVKEQLNILVGVNEDQLGMQQDIADNTSKQVVMVPVV